MKNSLSVNIPVLLVVFLLTASACETPEEDKPSTPYGIGVSRDEMQAALEEDPFGFTFDPPSLVNGPPTVLGYLLQEGQEGVVVLIGPPGSLTEITIMTPITGAHSRTGVSRLTELTSLILPKGERAQGADAWVGDHVLLAVEEGPQSVRFDDICMQMEWFDRLEVIKLLVERCAP